MQHQLSIAYGPILLLISLGLMFIIVALVKLKQLLIWTNSWIENLILSHNIRRDNIKVRKYEKAYIEGVPPVLYLRAFSSDGTKRSEKESVINEKPFNLYKFKNVEISARVNEISVDYNFERSLAKTSNRIGPFIAIGKLSKTTINLGAKRLYFQDIIWKQSASLLMGEAAMIIVKISGIFGTGFVWEITEIKSRYLEKTIFCIDIYNEREYNNFVLAMHELNLNFPMRFDTFKELGIYFSFDAKGQYDACHDLDLHTTFLKCRKSASKKYINTLIPKMTVSVK